MECELEFDVTGFGRAEGYSVEKDLKWISMGDASTFGDFGSFRNHGWKMHLEQRADGDGTGMKVVWRNGRAGHGEEPGDHETKLSGTSIQWNNNETYRFRLVWDGGGFGIFVNGEEWISDSFSQPYAAAPASGLARLLAARRDAVGYVSQHQAPESPVRLTLLRPTATCREPRAPGSNLAPVVCTNPAGGKRRSCQRGM